MARRWIDTDLWSDPKITDSFTPEDKYFWLFLLTTRFSNLSGCFEISIKQMSKDISYSTEAVENLLERFENVHKLIFYSKETSEIFILNYWKYNWTRSPKFEVALTRFISQIKNESFRNLAKEIQKLYINNDTVSIPYRYCSIVLNDTITIPTPITNTITTNTDTNIKLSKESSKSFKKPTIEEIKQYCESRNNKIDPKQFYSFYQSKGWMIGKNEMKDWKAAVVTWERNEANRNNDWPNGVQIESEVKDDGKFNRIDNR